MEPPATQQDTFVPFTIAERIEQLGEIDKDIVSLLCSTAQALQSLGKKETQDGDTAVARDNDLNVFQDSMNDFMRTLRRVNVGMKRQIMGLEEAGIISLRKEDNATTADSQGTAGRQPRLEPDGEGKIGGFDVGWLNSRSDLLERQTENRLFDEAETFLQELLDKQLKIDSKASTSGS